MAIGTSDGVQLVDLNSGQIRVNIEGNSSHGLPYLKNPFLVTVWH